MDLPPAPATHLSESQRRQLSEHDGDRLLGISPFLASAFNRDAGLADWLLADERLSRPQTPESIVERAQPIAEADSEAELMRRLRQARNRELVLALWRDLTGRSELAETLAAVSALADCLISLAHDWVEAELQQRHGIPRDGQGNAQRMVVLGLGKLGGGELNFSSDVDLIFAFPEAGETDGGRVLDNEQFFTRLGRRLIRVLDEITPDGQAYRVDMRLRPFGDSGPLVMNFNGMETYYQLHGREWERYALIKARPVAGDLAAGEALMKDLQPFVYRRYLDYSVFSSLREMKQGIRREVRRKGLENNIKLGRGGIREIEFIAQLFQLIRGGREPELRSRRLLPTLEAIARAGHIDADEVRGLLEAYEFLRMLENRIQGLHDAQTHELPRDDDDRRRLLAAMDEDSWEALTQRIGDVREGVGRAFDEVFVGPALPEEQRQDDVFADLWGERLDADTARKLLRRTGFSDPEQALSVLAQLRASHAVRRMGERGRQRLDRLMPSVLHLAAGRSNPGQSLKRMVSVLEAVATRTAYLSLLVENPRALEHLGRLCSASPWIADRIARHPLLLDELIDPRIFQQAPDPEDYARELDELLAPVGDDLERLMDGLREFHQAAVLRVAAADISDCLDAPAVSDRLSLVAELILKRVLDIARNGLIARHGRPRCSAPEPRDSGFIIVAYGKLGSAELAYGSDLDLVFLHDSAGDEQQTDGDKPLDNGHFFARLAQRIIHQLATPTPAGVLYEVDTRLRPSGSAGLLVSSLQAFEAYQLEKAWTWEHQALLRARPVAGDPDLMRAFEQARRTILARPRDLEGLHKDIREMRARMLAEQPAGDDLKRLPGGLIDVEFLCQYWTLQHAVDKPALLEETGTIPLLRTLAANDCIASDEAEALITAASDFRAHLHARTLAGEASDSEVEHLAAHREQVTAIWERHLGG